MGFYGNISNTSKTTFTFDRIYNNRLQMDNNCASDGVFLGRYVLVEYGLPASQYIIGYLDNNGNMYDDPTDRSDSHIILCEKGKMVKVNRNRYWYLYTGDTKSDGSPYWRYLTRITNDRVDDEQYNKNYQIDYPVYGRGYDSTVWIKQYVNNQETYIQIAELNTVVPNFSIYPLLPQDPYVAVDNATIVYQPGKYYYYDEADSHYKLDNNDIKTEGRVYYLESELGPAITADQSSTNLLYKLRVPTNFQLDLDDNNIYYNKEGFSKTKRSYDGITKNSINYKLSQSGYRFYYNVEQDNVVGEPIEDGYDRKSLVVKLPALGNAVCETYDLLYGQNRDDSITNFDKTNVKGALNTLNRKMNLGKLETNKLIYFSTETDNDINDNYMKSATIQGDNLISIDADIEKNKGAIKITHNNLDVNKASKSYGKDVDFSTFGSSVTLPKLFTDRAGHVVKEETFSVSIPKGSYENTKEGNVLTSLSFIDTTGALSSEKSYLGTLTLGTGYITNDKLNTITKDTTLNDSITKLIENSDSKYNTLLGQTNNSFGKDTVPTLYGLRQGINSDRTSISNLSSKIDILNGVVSTTNSVAYSIKQAIDKLDKADNKVDKQFVTAVEEKDGLITVSRSALQESDLPITFDGTYSNSNKVATMSSLNTLKANLLGDYTGTLADVNTLANSKLNEDAVRGLTYNATSGTNGAKTIAEMFDLIVELQNKNMQLNTTIKALQDKDIELNNLIAGLRTDVDALKNNSNNTDTSSETT